MVMPIALVFTLEELEGTRRADLREGRLQNVGMRELLAALETACSALANDDSSAHNILFHLMEEIRK